jgi:hypothetical protein
VDEYEEEKPTFWNAVTARSGYDPHLAPKLITRLLNTRYESNNQHYRKDSIRLRSGWIARKAGSIRKQAAFSKTKAEYLQHKSLLDRPDAKKARIDPDRGCTCSGKTTIAKAIGPSLKTSRP